MQSPVLGSNSVPVRWSSGRLSGLGWSWLTDPRDKFAHLLHRILLALSLTAVLVLSIIQIREALGYSSSKQIPFSASNASSTHTYNMLSFHPFILILGSDALLLRSLYLLVLHKSTPPLDHSTRPHDKNASFLVRPSPAFPSFQARSG